MDISQMQAVFQEGTEQSRLSQSLQEQKSALQEGTMPEATQDVGPGELSPEQHDINESLLPDDAQAETTYSDSPTEGHDPITDIPDEQQMEQATHPETDEPLEVGGESVGADGLTETQRDHVEDIRNAGDHEGAAEQEQFYRGSNKADWEMETERDWPQDTPWPGEYGI